MHPLVWILFIIGILIRLITLPLFLIASIFSFLLGLLLTGFSTGYSLSTPSENGAPSTDRQPTLSRNTIKLVSIIYNVWFFYIFVALYLDKASNYIIGIGVPLEMLLIAFIFTKILPMFKARNNQQNEIPNTQSDEQTSTQVESPSPILYNDPYSAPYSAPSIAPSNVYG